MIYRILSIACAAFALTLFVGAGGADEKAGTHDGIVVKAADSKLVMTDKDGKKEHTHVVSKTAKITCEGKECKLEDLKKGFTVQVTVDKENNKNVATRIEAKKGTN